MNNKTEPAYIIVDVNNLLSRLGKRKTSKEVEVLLMLAQSLNRTGSSYSGKISTDNMLKRDISEKLNMSKGTLNNMLTSFVKRGVLTRLDRGVYQLAPGMFIEEE